MVYNGCDYLSMLGLKLNHVSEKGHWWRAFDGGCRCHLCAERALEIRMRDNDIGLVIRWITNWICYKMVNLISSQTITHRVMHEHYFYPIK